MRRGWLLILLLLLPVSARADGVVIPPTAFPASVSIPDQRALLCWSNGVERLAIDTRFVGQGTNFAWVVPLPAKPAIEEATSGLFPTLEYIFRPALIHNVFPLYSILLFCVGVGYLLLYVRKNTAPQPSDTVISALTALVLLPFSGCIACALFFIMPYAVWRVRVGREGLLAILLAIFFVMILSALLLPALGNAGVTVAAPQVSVLSTERVGGYDTTTVSAKDPGALLGWLKENNYAPPPGTESIVSNYVKRGWVFVATRLHRDSSGKGTASPPPLCFTFSADKAVYPMQLTGVGASKLQVELFVFGPSQAEANYFHADLCYAAMFPESPEAREHGPLCVVHPLLRKWVAGSMVATKLSATLSPEQMRDDVDVGWIPIEDRRKTLYSNKGASFIGLNWGAGVFAVCLILGSIAAAFNREWQSHLKELVTYASMLALTVGTVVFIALPRIEVRLVRGRPGIEMWMTDESLARDYSAALTNGVSVKQAQTEISQMAATKENVFLGGPIREEDSPGNYIFRASTNGADFVWFDGDGGEHTDL